LHPENEHFPELDLLFRLQKILGVGQVGSMLEGLHVLQQALETIAEYAEFGNIALKNQIQDYGYCLKQQYEYVKFFAGVCGKELPVAHLNGLLQLCGAKVAENLEFQVSTLHIDQSKLDAGYYHKAISYLENYPNSKPCIKLKALCYSSLATNIFEHKNDSDSAIGYYIKAVKTNNQLPEVYEKLGQLFFNKGQYAKAIEAYKVVNNEFDIKLCFKEWLKQSPKNPDIMLKQAKYFESIGLFESAKKSYHHAFSLSKNETVKANALEKIGNIMANAAVLGQNFTQKAQDHDFFNFDSVTPEFIHNLLGDAAILDNFHA
jgi:tetratricopeptide (TPR) repeat protein